MQEVKETHWDLFENFTKGEFDCKETGQNEIKLRFMVKLQALRYALDEAMIVTSGFRAKEHSIEARKATPGFHAEGIALDIGCHSDKAWDIVKIAMQLNFYGIGVSQKNGRPRFIHLDDRPKEQKALYSY